MMGIRIELTKYRGRETVDIRNDGDFKWFYVPHAEFKAACCRGLGLVDLSAVDENGSCLTKWQIDILRKAYGSIGSKLTGRSKAADVLAAASRRLA